MANFRIRLNSVDKTEALLQEIYDDACRQMNLCQDKINELTESTKLADEPLEAKTKYSKAIHDLVTDKDKSIGRKLDVAKLMAEILKFNNNTEKMITESEVDSKLDLSAEMKKIREQTFTVEPIVNNLVTEEYKTHRSSKKTTEQA